MVGIHQAKASDSSEGVWLKFHFFKALTVDKPALETPFVFNLIRNDNSLFKYNRLEGCKKSLLATVQSLLMPG